MPSSPPPPPPLSRPASAFSTECDGLCALIYSDLLRALPMEACGVCWRDGGGKVRWLFFEREAMREASQKSFTLEPRALLTCLMQIDAAGGEVVAWFHSHPTAPPLPSEADREAWFADGRQGWWPRAFLGILSFSAEARGSWALYKPLGRELVLDARGRWQGSDGEETPSWGGCRRDGDCAILAFGSLTQDRSDV